MATPKLVLRMTGTNPHPYALIGGAKLEALQIPITQGVVDVAMRQGFAITTKPAVKEASE